MLQKKQNVCKKEQKTRTVEDSFKILITAPVFLQTLQKVNILYVSPNAPQL